MPNAGSIRRVTVLRHVVLASGTAFVFGVLDGIWSTPRSEGIGALYSILVCAGTLATAGAIVGLVQGALALVLGPALRARFGRLWNRVVGADGQGDTVAATHAWVTTALVVAVPLVLGFLVVLQRSERIKEEALQTAVIAIGAAGGLVAALVAFSVMRPAIERGWERIHRTRGLPIPRSRALWYALYVALPVGLLLVPMFTRFGVKLGVLSTPFALIVFFTAQGLLLRLGQAVANKGSSRSGVSGNRNVALLGGLLVALVAGTLFSFEYWPGAGRATRRGDIAPTVTAQLQRLTDIDRDGVSSLFGGGDCAALDASRSPTQSEIPGNGIDEDCDGTDAAEGQTMPPLDHYHGALPATQQKRFNVLLVVVDSLRPDHLGVYGYRQKTSPYMDQLARDAWLFTDAYAQSSTTALSMPSMLSGRRPSSMRWKGGYPQAQKSERSLPALLSEHGYETTLVINRYVKRHLTALQRDFAHVATVPEGADWKSGPYIISNVMTAVDAAQRDKRPFFITAHFDDVHHPYIAHREGSVPTFLNANRDIASYDQCVVHFDNMLRLLTAHLKRVGVWDDTVVILTSDHGEEFGEHGGTIHSLTCYTESVRVPLIVRVPGQTPKRIPHRVALTDLAPTVIEALALPQERIPVDGQSLFIPALSPARVSPSRPIFCSIFQLMSGRKNFFTRSVRTDKHALLYEALSDRVELYDTTADPGERHDHAQSDPETVEALRELLKSTASGNLWEARRFK